MWPFSVLDYSPIVALLFFTNPTSTLATGPDKQMWWPYPSKLWAPAHRITTKGHIKREPTGSRTRIFTVFGPTCRLNSSKQRNECSACCASGLLRDIHVARAFFKDFEDSFAHVIFFSSCLSAFKMRLVISFELHK